MRIDQVTVIGLGLIGGSLAWSIKDKELAKVVGYARRQETLDDAVDKGIIDVACTGLVECVENSQIIFVCTTIDSITGIVKDIADHVAHDAIIVDVASTKKEIVYELESFLPEEVSFIGGHPMAGSDKSGIEAATLDLFDGAKFILTPYKNVHNQKLVKLNHFLEKLGIDIEYLSPDQHDLAVAAISHLPYVLASTLVNTIAYHKERDNFIRVASSGFKDTTRVSASPAVWGKNICVTNKESILTMIEKFRDHLVYLESLIKLDKEDELLHFFENAGNVRKELG